MKRTVGRAAALFCAAALLLCAPARALADISASSAILVDAASGRVLWERDAHTRRQVASTTKLMTALVALESLSLDETVAVSARAAGTEGSSMYLRAGETLTAEELLYGLLLASGNDAAEALAEHVAGSGADFAARMNGKAAALGMEDTCFEDPSGLSETAYSTAADMALLAAAALRDSELCKLMAAKTVSIGSRSLTNHNKLLWREGGFFGGKTGYTRQAGRCLVSFARQNGQTLLAVTLRDPNDWADHAALMAYGFSAYPRQTLCAGGAPLYFAAVEGGAASTVALAPEETLSWPLAAGEAAEARFSVPDTLRAPVAAGEAYGTVTYYVNGEPTASCALLAAEDVPVPEPARRGLLDRLRGFFS